MTRPTKASEAQGPIRIRTSRVGSCVELAANERATVDRERDVAQHRDEDRDATEGDAQQNQQASGDEQSVPEDPDIEVERRATGDPSRTGRN